MHIPGSTYRFQFHKEFPFQRCEELAEYLHRLGITDVYSSPALLALEESTHCYDVLDHTVINPVLGGIDALKSLSRRLQEHDIKMILDIVPNHMGIMHPDNPQWWDVLEYGRVAESAGFFDIDWNSYKRELHNRVQLPALGAQFGVCLENGEITLSYSAERGILVHYYGTVLPTDPRTWHRLADGMAGETSQLSHEDRAELEDLSRRMKQLAETAELEGRGDNGERLRTKQELKRQFMELVARSATAEQLLLSALQQMNGDAANPETFNDLELLLNEQNYRLSFWRVAADEINYRRFFDVNTLAGIRVELPHVFNHVHTLVFQLVRDGYVHGLRIDHPDGLLNPPQYFQDLQRGCCTTLIEGKPGSDLQCQLSPEVVWVVVEKILGLNEQLQTGWPVHGTTGYDYLNVVNGVFVNRASSSAFSRIYRRFTGAGPNFPELRTTCKKLILDNNLSGELYTLSRQLDRISETNRRTRDFTLQFLREALAEFIAAFPVYRSYIKPDSTTVEPEDRRHIETAIQRAKRRNPSMDPTVFDWLATILLLDGFDDLPDDVRRQRMEFILALQQTTGPVTAKGIEDTAFYREYPLVSLNEVGGEPDHFGFTVREYHDYCANQAQHFPHSMLATSTHDTKRSEDVRARINVLSEMPKEWEKSLFRWKRMNARFKTQADGIHVPTSADEYLFYQTLVGLWPLNDDITHDELVPRIANYMIKAGREAKIHTSWINVNEDYENALVAFVEKVLNPRRSAKFLEDFRQFAARTSLRGAGNALAQVVLKMTSPGIPDLYQGCELWDFSLVDPDNRRPVDYGLRRQLLDECLARGSDAGFVQEIVTDWRSAKIKMHTISRTLAFRRENADLFRYGAYIPLEATGPRAEHVLAFARQHENTWAITVVPRLLAGSGFAADSLVHPDFWHGTEIELPGAAPCSWSNVLSWANTAVVAGKLPLADVLSAFPVAVLAGGGQR